MISASLFRIRLNTYQKRMLRYARYMMNDHFMIILFFLFGFLLVQYASWVQTIRLLEAPLVIFLSFVLALIPFIGRVATFVEPADAHFLSVIGQDFRDYYRHALLYSWLLPIFVSLLAVGIVMPIVSQAYGSILIPFIGITATLLVGKWLYFQLEQGIIEGRIRVTAAWTYRILLYLVMLISLYSVITIIWSVTGLLIPLLLFLMAVGISMIVRQKRLSYQWDILVDHEISRQQRIFRIISLFVDVPFVKKSHAHRRIWLDPFVNWLTPRAFHPYRFVLARSVVRSGQYLPLLLQLVILTGVVATVSPQWYWILVINSLLLVLLSFQFASLYPQTKEEVMYVQKLFRHEEMMDDFVGIVYQLTAIASVLVTIISSAMTGQYLLLSGIIFYPIIVITFVEMYLKNRLKKTKKRIKR